MGIPDEYFNEEVSKQDLPNEEPTVANQLRHALVAGTTPNGVFSVKLMPYQFRRVLSEGDPHWLNDAYWVWVRRRDLIAQAISFEIALQTNSWTSNDAPLVEPVFSSKQILQRLIEIHDDEVRWAEFFQSRRFEMVTLWYEDFEHCVDKAVQSVARLVQVVARARQQQGRLRKVFARRAPLRNFRFPELQVQRNHRNSIWREIFLASRDAENLAQYVFNRANLEART